MSTLPFTVSPDAATWISEKLGSANKEPEFAGLIPGLYYFLDGQCKDEEGHVFEWCPYPFFDIGWERPENVVSRAYIITEILGPRIFVPLVTLEKLKGKQLVLETVDVGFPRAADRKRRLLRAASCQPE